ncbi:MAG: dihydrofolate reductase [Burkholderiales bacterium]|nr:dihydrofolate reductase [Burkholderiales bacterium]
MPNPQPAAPRICLIAALAANRVIGNNNKLPWHLPADLKRFKSLTMGHPLVMGRKTFESIGRPLPGRRNLVVTRNHGYSAPGCEIVHSLDEALEACRGTTTIFIIGGAQLYRESLPRAHRLEFTEIHAEFAGDAVFPEYSRAEWREVARETHRAEAGVDFDYDFVRYERRD